MFLVILITIAAMFVGAAICAGLFTTFAKSHGLRVAMTGLAVAFVLLFVPLTQVKFAGFRGFHFTAFAVLALALACIWRNTKRPLLLVLPIATICALTYIWFQWPALSPSPFRSGTPDGIPGMIFVVFNLGGAAMLAFILLVQCHTPLKEKTEK
ncbi:hypothetical protein ABVF61_28410 [Roseibium sp. HPY-6]|uniref:hypothetical protein n=1 Tax=Roseibium sp. HPY-6 TaxID=3229852 RepID=UPI00338D4491